MQSTQIAADHPSCQSSKGEPTVSFVVPCYNLAQYLPECLNSMLAQSYGNFEVLIMDDASPDNTSEVARSFRDPRIRYVRNDPNLGHLRNYNKGISLSRGKYVWLISADDYLRRAHVLRKYVDLMDSHPDIGYVFSPGFGVRDGVETRLLGRFASRWDRDRILRGHTLLKKLLRSNFVLTPSGMVRRECYARISLFRLDLPWVGDWYLWCLFALYHDVGYLAEHMLCYREQHALSMTEKLIRASQEKLDACAAEEISIPWLIRSKAREMQNHRVDRACLDSVAHTYARTISSQRYRNSTHFMNFRHFERSLTEHTSNDVERNFVRARVYAEVGNEYYWQSKPSVAKRFYQAAIRTDPRMGGVITKRLLLSLGRPGDYIRRAISGN